MNEDQSKNNMTAPNNNVEFFELVEGVDRNLLFSLDPYPYLDKFLFSFNFENDLILLLLYITLLYIMSSQFSYSIVTYDKSIEINRKGQIVFN